MNGVGNHPAGTTWIRDRSQRVRDFDARHPRWWDVTPTVVLALLVSISVLTGSWRDESQAADQIPDAAPWVELTLFVLPLCWRRYYPFAVLLSMSLPAVLSVYYGMVTGSDAALMVALYGVARRCPIPRLVLGVSLYAAAIVIDAVRWGADFQETTFGSPVAGPVFILLGLIMRIRNDQVTAQREHAARMAAVTERTRIAREMHDIIGHNLSVITSLADGGAYAARRSPERAQQALDAIGDTSRQALTELRRVLGVLRADLPEPADRYPQPDLDNLDELLDRVRAAGLPVRSTLVGSPDGLSAGRQLTTYRMVQESLTNVIKYAAADTEVEVRLTGDADGLDVTVVNTGPTLDHREDGQGITGMRERVALYDGTLEAGPLPSGGWRVRMWLPRDGNDDDSADRR